jgi:hypothetical protein
MGCSVARRTNGRRRLLLVATIAALLGGCGPAPPAKPAHLLVLDVQIQAVGGTRALQGVSLLLDGKQVARFDDPRAESTVVFGKAIEGVAPGKHEVTLRIDAQTASPTLYDAVGVAHYDARPVPLAETGGALKTGQAFRFELPL